MRSGASAVAVGWSGHIVGLLDDIGHTRARMRSTRGAQDRMGRRRSQGGEVGGIVNLPAVLVVAFVTALLVIGTKESATFNAVLVAIKVAALTAVHRGDLADDLRPHRRISTRSRRAAGAAR